MQKEIGSEFAEYTFKKKVHHKLPDWLNWGQENRLLATGRTALDHIICDIKANHPFKSVYMPSYCCKTMIEPFTSNGVEVLFYDVLVNDRGVLDYDIDFNVNCTALFFMNYFGYSSSKINNIIEYFKNRNNVIIIEDATHSLFCTKKNYSSNSDFVFASIRKWTAIPGGGLASKINHEFTIAEPTKSHDRYVNMKIEGMKLKEEYLKSFNTNKNSFLQIFLEAENLLGIDYKSYTIDDMSLAIIEQLDIHEIKSKRISNARQLIDGLNNHSKLKLLFNDVSLNDCPLFVPIIILNGLRDKVKKYLIENNIFCPVHWSKSNLHILNKRSEFIFDQELSIVCDQRYSRDEMENIISIINNI